MSDLKHANITQKLLKTPLHLQCINSWITASSFIKKAYFSTLLRAEMQQIIWTRYAEERLRQWQLRFDLSRSEIELCVFNPEQVVQEEEVQVAQSRYAGGLLRVVYADVAFTRRIITLYWTNQVSRYWVEANNEN